MRRTRPSRSPRAFTASTCAPARTTTLGSPFIRCTETLAPRPASEATLLIALGAHPKAIQERRGQSAINITLDRYGHLFRALDEALTERLEDMRTEAVGEVARSPLPSDSTVVPLERL